jgi:hypothetical protein
MLACSPTYVQGGFVLEKTSQQRYHVGGVENVEEIKWESGKWEEEIYNIWNYKGKSAGA